jgi:hypothetical protein
MGFFPPCGPPQQLGAMFSDTLGSITVEVTGLGGYLTFPVKTPLWFVVMVAVAASVLQLLKERKDFAIPVGAQWGAAILAVAWVGRALGIALLSGKATLGIGAILGLLAAATPLVLLGVPSLSAGNHSTDQQ